MIKQMLFVRLLPVSTVGYMLETTANLTQPFTIFGYSETTKADLGVIPLAITYPGLQMYFQMRRPQANKLPLLSHKNN